MLNHRNFALFLLELTISLLAFLVMGFLWGFFAALMTASVLILSSAWYWTLTPNFGSQRVEVREMWGYSFRMEVA